ncbi:OmpA family protein [Sulfitobacter sp. JB4-11]|uniref:OmpA family protein n=1 Tax=Sulfitobacter rhodophyticola TaxID=3238304 RepID=UPI003518F21C
MNRTGLALGWMMLAASPLAALELSLPAPALLLAERNSTLDRYAAPIGPFADGAVETRDIEGTIRRAAWRLDAEGQTPLEVIAPLRDQLQAADYDIVLDCAAEACGGFDFRFATEVLPAPHMYVNIRAYHVITARRGGNDVVSVMASTSAGVAYVQIIHAASKGTGDTPTKSVTASPTTVTGAPLSSGNMGDTLLARGHLVLDALDFETGAAELGPGPFDTLRRLADFLKSRPDLQVALVGHTDSVGSLDGNISLSRRRAQAVRQHLIEVYGVPAAQMEAEGMGYLAPLASNLDAAGRDANRRVEVVVLRTEE